MHGVTDAEDPDWAIIDVSPAFAGDDQPVNDHIARHDPARVLREVAAGRALLVLYDEAVNGPWADLGVADALEKLIIARAAVYSDHPDYDPGWR